VLHLYYAGHPLDPAVLAALAEPAASPEAFAWSHVGDRLGRLLVGHAAVAAWCAALLGLGLAVAPLAGRPGSSAGERRMLAFGLGLAAAMLLWLGLGLCGLWFRVLAFPLAGAGTWLALRRGGAGRDGGSRAEGWLLCALSAAAGLNAAILPALAIERALRGALPAAAGWCAAAGAAAAWLAWLVLAARWLARRAAAPGGNEPPPVGRWLAAAFGVLAALALSLQAAAVETPERFYDAQVYHLGMPALFAMRHKAVALPNLLHAAFPSGLHMAYGWLWLLGGEPAARAWRLWLVALLGWTLFRFGERAGWPGAGLAAAALALTSPLLALNAMQTSVDVELALLVALAGLAVLEARRRRSLVPASGALAGAALAMKSTAVFWAPWLLLGAALRRRGGRLRPSGARALAFAATAAIWAAPWPARNALDLGNPIYPYFTEAFPRGRQWDPARLERFKTQAANRVVHRWRDAWRFPWLIAKGDTSEDYLGAAFLVAIPLAAACPPSAPALRAAGVLAGLSLVSWAAVTHVPRFALATWLWLLVWGAGAAWELLARRPWLGRLGLALLVVTGGTSFLAGAVQCRAFFDPVEWLAGRESRAAYLERKTINPYTSIALSAGSLLPARGSVMLVGETRGLYWPRPFLNHSVYDVQAFEEALRGAFTAADLARRIRQRGASALFVNDRETSRLKFRFQYPMLEFGGRERPLVDEFWDRWTDLVADSGRYARLYLVRRAPKPVGVKTARPLSLDEHAMRIEFEGFATITWEGDAEIRATHEVIEGSRRRVLHRRWVRARVQAGACWPAASPRGGCSWRSRTRSTSAWPPAASTSRSELWLASTAGPPTGPARAWYSRAGAATRCGCSPRPPSPRRRWARGSPRSASSG
jgi:hypothetical protein